MMQKKITELLEVLDQKEPIHCGWFHEACFDRTGNIRILRGTVSGFWSVFEKRDIELTELWNSLTGEELKNVTWVI